MRKRKLFVILAVAACVALLYASAGLAVAQDIPRISKEKLKAALGDDDVVVIDVRIPKDYDQSKHKIPGAIRENPMDVRYWSPYPKNKTIVLYCA
jgi:rhodanese-related sulfurtransferase